MGEQLHLLPFEAAALREEAAAEILGQIRRYQGLAPAKLRPLLAYLEAHLFDPELTVARLLQACQVGDTAVAVELGQLLGKTPKKFIEGCRHALAKKLLGASLLPITELAEMLGFSSLGHFHKSFERAVGETPSSYRERAWQGTRGRKAGAAEEKIRRATCEKFVRGELEAGAVAVLARQLLLLHPAVDQALPEAVAVASPVVTLQSCEAELAEERWQELARLPPGHRPSRVVQGYRYHTPALFHLLCRKSREAAWRNAEEALTLARLSLTSLACLASPLPPAQHAELQALGHAWIGHAQRLLHDLTGAEHSFAVAEAYLLGSTGAPLVEAYTSALKAHLRWWQRRLPEAQALTNRAIELFSEHGTANEQAEALVLRALVHRQEDASEAAILDLMAAERRIIATSPLHLQHSVYYNLARCYLEAGEPWKALEYLPRTRVTGDQLGHPQIRYLLAALEGSAAQVLGRGAVAEVCLLEAWHGFQEIQQPVYAGLAGIDLAYLYTEQGRITEVMPLLAQILPWLATLELQGEMGVVRKLLNDAVAAREVTLAMLDRVRALLQRVEKDLLPTPKVLAPD